MLSVNAIVLRCVACCFSPADLKPSNPHPHAALALSTQFLFLECLELRLLQHLHKASPFCCTDFLPGFVLHSFTNLWVWLLRHLLYVIQPAYAPPNPTNFLRISSTLKIVLLLHFHNLKCIIAFSCRFFFSNRLTH